MFKWIRNLRCQHSWKYIAITENTKNKMFQGKYEQINDINDMQYIFTNVIYRVCKNCHKQKKINELWGTDATMRAAEYVKTLNNL